MKFFSVYGLITGIAYGRTLTYLSKSSVWEIILFSISIAVTLGILMFAEFMVREKKRV